MANHRQHSSPTSSLLHRTGVKRSAFGRLSGRQRPDADEVEGDERQQRRGNGAPASVSRTTGPLRGTRYASSFSVPYASAPGGIAGAACLRDIPCGNVVSRWTLVESEVMHRAMSDCRDPDHTLTSSSFTSSIVPRLRPRSRALGTPFRPATCNESALRTPILTSNNLPKPRTTVGTGH